MYVLMVFFHLTLTSTKPNDRYSQNPPLPLSPLHLFILKGIRGHKRNLCLIHSRNVYQRVCILSFNEKTFRYR